MDPDAPRDRFRIVILGGYGHFGGRITRRLATDPGLDVTIAGRSADKAGAFIARLAAAGIVHATGIRSAVLNASDENFSDQLAALMPDLVIHTAGPFQGQDYRVAEACLGANAHYLDLADGRDFVCGIGQFDDDARARNLLFASGTSTLPAVSSAVVNEFVDQFDALERIAVSVALAQKTERGLSTIAAALSFCGKSFLRWENGEWRSVYGWQDMRRERYPGIGRRWMAACDVPDLALFPELYAGRPAVTFHAALESPVMQWSLWCAAWAVRAKLVNNWAACAGALKYASDRLDAFGGEDSAMRVDIDGSVADGSGARQRITWDLLARRNHGPEIPATPAVILARKLAAGAIDQRGAMPCTGLFDLQDFAAAVAEFDIEWHATR